MEAWARESMSLSAGSGVARRVVGAAEAAIIEEAAELYMSTRQLGAGDGRAVGGRRGEAKVELDTPARRVESIVQADAEAARRWAHSRPARVRHVVVVNVLDNVCSVDAGL